MQPRSDASLNKAWASFFAEYHANLAVTLAYNSILTGTVFPAYRIADHGECNELSMTSLRARPEERRLATTVKIPCEQIHVDVDRPHRSIDRKLFGSRFHRLTADKRSRFIGLIENPETNVHVHLLWHVPEDRLEQAGKLIDPLWRRATRYGSTKIKRPYDRGWGPYGTKRRPALKAPELFLASRTYRGFEAGVDANADTSALRFDHQVGSHVGADNCRALSEAQAEPGQKYQTSMDGIAVDIGSELAVLLLARMTGKLA